MSDDSKTINVTELTIAALEQKCYELSKSLVDTNKILTEKISEIAHLKRLLEGTTNIIQPLTDEEEIAIVQLGKIKEKSRAGALTLEDVKIYDTLVKNKRLSQGDVTNINGVTAISKLDKKSLIQIAGKKSNG